MSIKDEAQEESMKEGSPVLSVSLELAESTVHSDASGVELCLDCAEKRKLSREWRSPLHRYIDQDHYWFNTEEDFLLQLPSHCDDCGVFLGGRTLEEMGYTSHSQD